MENFDTLNNHFLIAMPGLEDPNFHRTVTLICQHNSDGAMGIVINRHLDIPFSEILTQLNIEGYQHELEHRPVFMGGPVQETRGFVLHEPLGAWESTLKISDHLGLSASRDILAAIAVGSGPDRWLLALGYAGWGPGQLEQEIKQNAWLNGPADPEVLFSLPLAERWSAAAELLGVDLSQLSGEAGHA
jgi:putative transcriptional regulator